MNTAADPAAREAQRLDALRRYDVLDTMPEAAYDRIVRLAARAFRVPVALISFIDADRQWLKAKVGIEITETPRAVAFCNRTIEGRGLCLVPDATGDPRFSDNPLVKGTPGIRFYAGMPLVTPDGHALGSLCVVDTEPHAEFTSADRDTLADLAAVVVDELELRRELAERKREAHRSQLRDLLLEATAGAGGFQSAIDAAMSAIQEAAGSMICLLYRLAPDGQRLQLVGGQGREGKLDEAYLSAIRDIGMTLENSVTGRSIRTETPLIFERFDDALLDRYPGIRLNAERGATTQIITPVIAGEDKYAMVHGFGAEVTDRAATMDLLAEAASTMRPLLRRLRDLEETELFRRAAEVSDDAVIIGGTDHLDGEGPTIRYVNEAFLRQTGYVRNEIIGRRTSALAGAGGPPGLDDHIRDELMERRIVHREVLHRRRDGSTYWSEISVAPLFDSAGWLTHWVAVSRDVTERRRVRMQLEEQAEMLAQARDAIVVRDLDHRVEYWNQSAERVYGWTREEMLGQSLQDRIFTDPEAFRAAMALLLEKGHWEGQLRVSRKDGLRLDVEARWTLLRQEDGTPRAVLSVNSDITERLVLESELRQAKRMEAVGQLTGGIAHDFNNLLTIILGNAEMLSDRLAADAGLRSMAEGMISAAERGAELTGRLLAFSRRQALDPRAVDVNRLLATLMQMLRRTLGNEVELSIEAPPGLWRALIDAAQLENAVLNLCLNARDAMPGGGRIVIETANRTFGADLAEAAQVAPGDYVMIAVSDSGTGMPPEVVAQAFEPFFTTKEVGAGSGLGLSMVYGFVKQSNGHVEIHSEVGHGTAVKIFIPRATVPGQEEEPKPAATSLPVGREHILVAEDDPLVRAHAVRQLHELGYRVTVAVNGVEALAVLAAAPGEFDLLFTDVVMPGGVSGLELARAAARLRPGLPVLFTSGYTEHAILRQGRLEPGALLLHKPYRRKDLADRVRLALDTRPALNATR